MKNLVLLVLLCVTTLHAQKNVDFSESISKDQQIYLHFKFANKITIEHGNSSKILVKASVNVDDGKGNEAFSIQKKNEDGQLKIYSDFGDYFKNKWNNKDQNDCNSKTIIDYVVTVPKNANLKVKSISGSVYVNTYEGSLITDLISGNVTIKKYEGELRLKTISGALDVTVKKAKLIAKSLTGTIYSDLDFDTNEDDKSYNSSYNKISKQINKGTTPLRMETISGNIYIRKG